MRAIRRAALVAIVVAGGGCELIAGVRDVGPYPTDGGALPDHCSDGMKDADETGKDCGGSCSPCPDGSGCMVGPDCTSKVCSGGTCLAPTCSDKVQNGTETDVDCGGSTCPPCGAGDGCLSGADCKSGACTATKCAASCTDGVQDGTETDVDCGGSCPGCPVARSCKGNVDCDSGVCESSKCADYVTWAKRFGGQSGTDTAQAVDIGLDTNDRALLAANFNGKASFGGTTYDTGSSAFSSGFAFARYDASGSLLWDVGLIDQGSLSYTQRMRASADGTFYAVGRFTSSPLVFSSTYQLTTPGLGQSAAFLVRYSASGTVMWAHAYDISSAVSIQRPATNAAGDLFLAGTNNGPSGTLGPATIQGDDGFLVDIVWNGGGWGHNFTGTPSFGAFDGIAMDPMGAIVASGATTGTDFGGGPIGAADAGYPGSMFLAKFTSSGTYLWAKSYAAPGAHIAVDAAGNIIACGQFSGMIDLGTGALSTTGQSVFVAKLDASGAAMWSKAFALSDASGSLGFSLATDASGDILLAGNLTAGTIDLGGGPLMPGMIVAKLDPSGAHLWSRSLGVAADSIAGIAPYDTKDVLIGGTFSGSLPLSGVTLASVGSSDLFLARLHLP